MKRPRSVSVAEGLVMVLGDISISNGMLCAHNLRI